jgi:hypothetical protein
MIWDVCISPASNRLSKANAAEAKCIDTLSPRGKGLKNLYLIIKDARVPWFGFFQQFF